MLLFETIKVEDGEPQNLEYHQKRVENSLGFTPKFDIKSLIKTSNLQIQKAKLIYSSSGIESIEITPYVKKEPKSFKLVESSIEYGKKYLDRSSIDELFSKKDEADEIIITHKERLKDTSIHNIALFIDNRWLTPAHPLLEGTTRRRLLDKGEIFESELSVEDIKKCSKIALLNSMVGFYVIDEFTISKAVP